MNSQLEVIFSPPRASAAGWTLDRAWVYLSLQIICDTRIRPIMSATNITAVPTVIVLDAKHHENVIAAPDLVFSTISYYLVSFPSRNSSLEAQDDWLDPLDSHTELKSKRKISVKRSITSDSTQGILEFVNIATSVGAINKSDVRVVSCFPIRFIFTLLTDLNLSKT